MSHYEVHEDILYSSPTLFDLLITYATDIKRILVAIYPKMITLLCCGDLRVAFR